MEKFKFYVSMNCISFTILVLLFTALSIPDVTSPVNTSAIFVLFGMTSCIAFVLFLTDKITVKNTPTRVLIDIVAILGVVLGIGMPLGFIPSMWETVLVAVGMVLVVYFGTFLVLTINAQVDADKMNKQIGEIRKIRKK